MPEMTKGPARDPLLTTTVPGGNGLTHQLVPVAHKATVPGEPERVNGRNLDLRRGAHLTKSLVHH